MQNGLRGIKKAKGEDNLFGTSHILSFPGNLGGVKEERWTKETAS